MFGHESTRHQENLTRHFLTVAIVLVGLGVMIGVQVFQLTVPLDRVVAIVVFAAGVGWFVAGVEYKSWAAGSIGGLTAASGMLLLFNQPPDRVIPLAVGAIGIAVLTLLAKDLK